MIRAVIFDYFDVIRPPDAGIRATYRRLGGNVQKDEVFIADVTTAANYGYIHDADQQLAARLGIPVHVWLQALAGTPVNDPDILSYIDELHVRGIKVALLSNASSEGLRTYFTPAELHRYFDAALVSGDTGLAKPEAAFYRLAANKLGVEPQECVMIDDRAAFCEGAKYIGMQAIVYQNFDQCKRGLEALIQNSSQSAK